LNERRRSRAVPLAVLAAALAGLSCAAPLPKKVDFGEVRRHFTPADYPQVLANWTRHVKVVRDVGTVIEMWGTYKSWEFRQAYVERYVDAYQLSDAERAALYKSQLEAVRNGYEFHVAVQTTNYKWNDLGKDSSAWRVSLLDAAGAELAPSAIETPRLPQIYEDQFFPNHTEFSTTYMIRFDRADAEAAGFKGPESGRIVFRVISPLAKAELVWEASSSPGGGAPSQPQPAPPAGPELSAR
jgi:hypothetical protein